MNNQDKLMNADFKFIVKPLETDEHIFVCDQFLDRKIVITINNPKTVLYTTNNLGQQVPMFNNEIYTFFTVFHASGFSFSYTVSKSNVFALSHGMPSLTPAEFIQNNMENCYLNFVKEDYCKQALSYFKPNDSIIFGRKITDNLPHFTLDVKRAYSDDLKKSKGDSTQYVSKSYIYDEQINIIYQTKDEIGNKFAEFFDGIKFSNSWFYIYESISDDSFKINIFQKEIKQYVRLKYEKEVLTITHSINNTTVCVKGDVTIRSVLANLVNKIIIDSPTPQLERYVEEFNLDLKTLTTEEIKLLNMVDC